MSSIKWFIRIMTRKDEEVVSNVKVGYFGKVFDLRTAVYFENFAHISAEKVKYVLIDPDLSFTRCWSASEKRSVKKFFKKTTLLDIHPELEKDMLKLKYLDAQTIETIVRKVLDFQRTIPVTSLSLRTLRTFFGLPEESVEETELYAILAPYFTISNVGGVWYKINLELLKTAIKYKKSEEKLYAVIAISRDILDDKHAIQKIISDYALKGIDGYAIWIVDFDEIDNASQIHEFKEFVLELKRLGKPILNLYGGYYSLLLSKLGLFEGIVTKVCYKQRRIPCQVGGPARENYYFPPVKNKIPLHIASYIIQDKPDYACSCPICKGGQIVKIQMSNEDLKKHFLYAFENEIKAVENKTLGEVLHQLLKDAEELRLIINVEHLYKWYDSLTT